MIIPLMEIKHQLHLTKKTDAGTDPDQEVCSTAHGRLSLLAAIFRASWA